LTLKLTAQNTICGRAPITVLLNLVQHVYGGTPAANNVNFSFVRYEQSSKCVNGRDSSVSYVSGILRPNK
jgi:predicted class III extradiol MEMO1 family dioxygenase